MDGRSSGIRAAGSRHTRSGMPVCQFSDLYQETCLNEARRIRRCVRTHALDRRGYTVVCAAHGSWSYLRLYGAWGAACRAITRWGAWHLDLRSRRSSDSQSGQPTRGKRHVSGWYVVPVSDTMCTALIPNERVLRVRYRTSLQLLLEPDVQRGLG